MNNRLIQLNEGRESFRLDPASFVYSPEGHMAFNE